MRKVRRWVPLVLFFWIAAASSPGFGASLLLTGAESGSILACLFVEENVPFHLEFINSIYLAPVRESFIYTSAEGLLLIRVESPSAGVFEYYGLIPDGTGVSEMRRPLGEIRLLSHDYGNHRLAAGTKILRVKGLIPDGEPLVIRVVADGPCRP